MTRFKIEDIAKEFGLSASEFIAQLNEGGFKILPRSKTLTDEQIADIRERWGQKKVSLTEVRKGDVLEKRVQSSVIRRRKVEPAAPEKSVETPKPSVSVSEQKPTAEAAKKADIVSAKISAPPVESKAPKIKLIEPSKSLASEKSKDTPEEIEEKEKKKAREKELKKKEEIEELARKRRKSFIKKRSEEFDISNLGRIERVFQPTKKKMIIDRSKMKSTPLTTPKQIKRIIPVSEKVIVYDLASALKIKSSELIRKLRGMGVEAGEFQSVDADTASLIATEYGYEVKNEIVTEESLFKRETPQADDLKPRPPVVTIMGHVDHGKTTLLDAIRKSDVALGEAGGITQHIGAYMVQVDGQRSITFIDTPGHEAFSAMRARGAKTTDIVILVVAADDGVMPQTKEAVVHAKAAGVPIIVAINKIDKPGGQIEKIKKQLADIDLAPEEWGGKTIYAPISAKNAQGIKELLELVLLQADLLELKASPKISAEGVVLEAKIAVGLGPMATILIQQGTLKKGDVVVAGTAMGCIRLIQDGHGRQLKEATPSYSVEISGLDQVPQSGDRFYVFKDEEAARRLVEWRVNKQKDMAKRELPSMTLEGIYEKMKLAELLELKIVLKADVQGSVEVIRQTIEKLSAEKIKLNVIFAAVGAITESDVHLASGASAIIIGFNIRPDTKARELIKRLNVDVRLYSIIYDVVEDIKKAMSGMLKPELKEVFLGRAEVRNVFHISKVGSVAGCFVTEGKITRNAQARLLRDHKPIYTGKIISLKRFKDDAREVQSGFECGISLQNYDDIKVGDIIEVFVIEEIKPVV
ncbi:MAG: translation initiation factor IF-2 [Deltaproteobacteria bacterium]